jgi:hypothetical protein
VYFEHRTSGTHAVLLLSSSGMDVKLRNNESATAATMLEYNVISGVFDFYFLAGSEADPAEAARQYAQVAGLPAEVPYWSFGLHQCRYGYQSERQPPWSKGLLKLFLLTDLQTTCTSGGYSRWIPSISPPLVCVSS